MSATPTIPDTHEWFHIRVPIDKELLRDNPGLVKRLLLEEMLPEAVDEVLDKASADLRAEAAA